MLKKLLKQNGIETNNDEFPVVMQMATEDIKFNQIRFNKKTSICEVIAIVQRSIITLRRCS